MQPAAYFHLKIIKSLIATVQRTCAGASEIWNTNAILWSSNQVHVPNCIRQNRVQQTGWKKEVDGV